jgi:hypothetical protein
VTAVSGYSVELRKQSDETRCLFDGSGEIEYMQAGSSNYRNTQHVLPTKERAVWLMISISQHTDGFINQRPESRLFRRLNNTVTFVTTVNLKMGTFGI